MGGLASRRGRVLAVVLVNHVAGVPSVLLLAPFFDAALDGQTLLWGSLAGLSGALGVAALFTGFARSSMAVVSPIAAVGAGAWPTIWQIIGGDVPGPIVFTGLVIGLVAIWTISSGGHLHDAEDVLTGTVFGLLAGLGFGGLLIFLSAAPDDSGIWALLPAKTVGALVILAIVLARKAELVPVKGSRLMSVASGVLVTVGNGSFLLASTKGSLAVVSVVSAMFPATTVILAWLILGEKLTRQRQLGLALALVAVGLVAGG